MKSRSTLILIVLGMTAMHTRGGGQTLPQTPPPNDLFSNAQVETGYHWYAYGVTKGATRQRKEVGKAIWYTWTAPASGPAIVRNWNEDKPFGSFNVFTGTNPAALKQVKPFKKDKLNFLFEASAGANYYISAQRKPDMDSYVDFAMDLELTTLLLTKPANNSGYKAPEAIPLSILTTEDPSMIASVIYYGPPTPIVASNSPPYSAVWTNSLPGHWGIYAQLTRTDGYVLNTAGSEIRVRPYNDDFADRKILVGTNIDLAESIAEATLEPGEPAVNYTMYGGNIWYEWTAPGDGYVHIPHVYGPFEEGISVFTGNSLATLNGPIPTIDTARNDMLIPVTAGQPLEIAVFDPGNLSIHYYAIPENDSFASATELLGTNIVLNGNNRAASAEPGEPLPPQAGGHTIWYSWTAPEDGTLILHGEYKDRGSSGSLLVTTFADAGGTNLTGVATNEFGFLYFVPPPANIAYVPVRGGTKYYLSVDNEYTKWEVGNFGNFLLELSFAPAQPNDSFAGRIALAGSDVQFFYTSLGASIEPGEPADGVSSLWWTWTAPYNGTVMVSGLQYNPAWGFAYVGDSLENLMLVATKGAYFFWDAVAGQTYQIAISSLWPGPLTAGLHLHYYTLGTPIEP